MSKPVIIRCETHPFHVASRTDDLKFFPLPMEEVWEIMVNQLLILNRSHQLSIHAFVLMGNHFHLLCLTPKGNLDEIMQRFLYATSRRLKIKWEPRYKWSLIDSQTHYFQVYRYILQNPVRAGICKRVEDYQFTTLKDQRIPIHSPVAMSFAGVEGEIRWLNEKYESDDEKLIQLGLRRSQFEVTQRKLKAFNKLSVPRKDSHD